MLDKPNHLWYNQRTMSKKPAIVHSTFVPSNNKQSKTLLAQILASEGIDVIHCSDAKTASFDVKHRKLILPEWESMSNELYDMFVGHEVGHALYTPYNEEKEEQSKHEGAWCVDAQTIGGDKYGHIAQQYLNIVEDARIERLMTNKFPGLRRDFVTAYTELLEKDFFELKNNPSNTRLFVDRANLHYKIGVSGRQELGIQFSEKEKKFLDRMANTETWEDVVQLTREIFDYEREEMEKQMKSSKLNENQQPQEDPSGEELMTKMMPKSEKLLQEARNKLQSSNVSSKQWIFPEPILERMIISSSEVQEVVNNNLEIVRHKMSGEICEKVFDQYANYKRDCFFCAAKELMASNKRSVSILTKQFEMKKAASLHKRQMISKSGRLDLEKIAQYRYNDDLFAKNMILRKGKNHGFVLFIDWSGSMAGVIQDVLRHAFMIAQFCKQCNIPFVVYAFTDNNVRYELESGRTILAEKLRNKSHQSEASRQNVYQDSSDFSKYTTDNPVWKWPKKFERVLDASNPDSNKSTFHDSRKANVDHLNLIEVCSSSMNNAQMTTAYATMLMSVMSSKISRLIQYSCTTGSSKQNSESISKPIIQVGNIKISLPPVPSTLVNYLTSQNADLSGVSQQVDFKQSNHGKFWDMSQGIDSCTSSIGLGGTPLDETVWAANNIVLNFRKQNNVEIMNTIFLSDGQGSSIFNISKMSEYERSSDSNKLQRTLLKTDKNVYDGSKIVDGSLYCRGDECAYSYHYRILVELHAQITGSRTMGIFITPSRQRSYYGSYSIGDMLGLEEKIKLVEPQNEKGFSLADDDDWEQYEKNLELASKQFEKELELKSDKKNSNAYLWKKEGYIRFEGIRNNRISVPLLKEYGALNEAAKFQIVSPYDTLYCIRADSLAHSEQNKLEELKQGSTVTQIKKAFSSQLEKSLLNKTLLMKICETISGEI